MSPHCLLLAHLLEVASRYMSVGEPGYLLFQVQPNELERHPVVNWTQAREGRLHTVTLGLHHRLTRQVLSWASANFAFHPNDVILRFITDTDLDSMMKEI